MLFRRTLAVALLCALPAIASAADEAAKADTIQWVLPWKSGTSLTYALEDLETNALQPARKQIRSTATVSVRITEANDTGFLQRWTDRDGKVEVLEGDAADKAELQALLKAFEGLSLDVELDADGNYRKLRNIDALVPVIRDAARPLMDQGVEATVAKIEDAALRASVRKQALAQVDTIAATMFAPAAVEGMLTRNIGTYNSFVGIDLEPDQAYELPVELPNPLGGPAFPAVLTFSLSVSKDDPDDLFVSFEQAIDSEKGKAAIAATAEKLVGDTVPKDAFADAGATVKDEGFFLVHRPTGVIEMFETIRTTSVQGKQKVERHRLRLLDGEHAHDWADDTAAAAPTTDDGDA